jgi:hypothetical protein
MLPAGAPATQRGIINCTRQPSPTEIIDRNDLHT